MACSPPGLAASSCSVYCDLKLHFVLAFHMDLMVVRRIFFKITNLLGKSVFRILIARATTFSELTAYKPISDVGDTGVA